MSKIHILIIAYNNKKHLEIFLNAFASKHFIQKYSKIMMNPVIFKITNPPYTVETIASRVPSITTSPNPFGIIK